MSLFTMRYPSLANENLVDVLRLIRTPNVGPVTFFNLMQRFGSAAHALAALPEMSLKGGRRAPLAPSSREDALKEIDATEKFGAQMILYGASDYPKLLTAIHDPSPVIMVRGSAHLWAQNNAIAIIGSRNASANGCQFAQKLAQDLGSQKLLVISGLARGIDAYAHKGALKSGTVGVIAGGIDNIYPPENGPLYAQMAESGAIISEQPIGMAPFSGSFPGRNRIIAGMSLGTVVVEASVKSGSLITARLALEYNREVLAVPGSPMDPRATGCNQLLKNGATMVENAQDVLRAISSLRQASLQEADAPSYTPDTIAACSDAELNVARQSVLAKLSPLGVSADELVEQCGLSAASVMTVLLELELAGKVRRSAGNKVALINLAEDRVA